MFYIQYHKFNVINGLQSNKSSHFLLPLLATKQLSYHVGPGQDLQQAAAKLEICTGSQPVGCPTRGPPGPCRSLFNIIFHCSTHTGIAREGNGDMPPILLKVKNYPLKLVKHSPPPFLSTLTIFLAVHTLIIFPSSPVPPIPFNLSP